VCWAAGFLPGAAFEDKPELALEAADFAGKVFAQHWVEILRDTVPG
jgi:hypothetical protein